MKRKSTAQSGRAIYPCRLMPRPRTTFRMDVVVEARLMMSQQKNIEWRTPEHRDGNMSPARAGWHSDSIHSFDSTHRTDQRCLASQHLRYHKIDSNTRKK